MTAIIHPGTPPKAIPGRLFFALLTGFRWFMNQLSWHLFAWWIIPRVERHPWLKQIPNALSIGRAVAAVPFALWLSSMIGHPAAVWWAIIGLLVYGLSDGIDGALARQLDIDSGDIGKAIDPLGDKVMFISLVFAYLWGVERFIPHSTSIALRLIVIVAVSMEVYLVAISLIQKYFSSYTQLALNGAAMVGKIKTLLQIILLLLGWPLLLSEPTSSTVPIVVTAGFGVSLLFNFGSVIHHSKDLAVHWSTWRDMSQMCQPPLTHDMVELFDESNEARLERNTIVKNLAA